MLLLSLLLTGCNQDVQLTYYTDTCQDWDLNNPEPQLWVEKDGTDITIVRMGVEEPFGAKFVPEIQASGWRIQIFENWSYEAVGDEEDICYGPTVVMKTPPNGTYEIQWFPEPNVLTPLHTETVVVDG